MSTINIRTAHSDHCRHPLRARLRVIASLLLGLLAVAACGIIDPPLDDTLSAETSPPSTTSTPVPCPTQAPITIQEPASNVPKLLYIIVDRSGSYQSQTQPAINQLIQVLPGVLEPGDRLMISWLGSTSDQPSEQIVNTDVMTVPLPAVSPTPLRPTEQMVPPPMATPTPCTDCTSTEKIAWSQTATAIARSNMRTPTAIAEQNMAARNAHGCQMGSWNNAYYATVEEWLRQRQAATDAAAREIQPTLETAGSTPVFDGTTRISAALLLAAQVFETERNRGEFQTFRLLIFSDMEETGPIGGEDEKVFDLTGVDVLVARQRCPKDIEMECQNIEKMWEPKWSAANVRSFSFLRIIETSDKKLGQFLSSNSLR